MVIYRQQHGSEMEAVRHSNVRLKQLILPGQAEQRAFREVVLNGKVSIDGRVEAMKLVREDCVASSSSTYNERHIPNI